MRSYVGNKIATRSSLTTRQFLTLEHPHSEIQIISSFEIRSPKEDLGGGSCKSSLLGVATRVGSKGCRFREAREYSHLGLPGRDPLWLVSAFHQNSVLVKVLGREGCGNKG
jgi:hypothetical protein